MTDRSGELAEHYEVLHQQGYVTDWSPARKRIIRDVLRELPLPAEGEALDFGCGCGVLTEILRQELPGWRIHGTDISPTALANARGRFPGCSFHEEGSTELAPGRFDLLFTHHVLEHALDLEEMLDRLAGYLKPGSAMLHVLPCGNPGSFEHRLARLREGGIDANRGNRFFFESREHERRLTTRELVAAWGTRGFRLERERYAGQRDGSIDWITGWELREVRAVTDPTRGIDEAARRELSRLRLRLMGIALLRRPVRLLRWLPGKGAWKLKHLLLLPALPVSILVDRFWRARARREWERRSHDPGAGEMILHLVRMGYHPPEMRAP